MEYHVLLDLATDLGYRLAMAGAETFRIEESIQRLLAAYGIDCEVFAIPNCLHVSIETADGQAMTRMRRIGYHGTDLDSVERYNSVCRQIVVLIPVAWLLAQTGRLELVWLAFPIAELMSLLMATIFLRKTMNAATARMRELAE